MYVCMYVHMHLCIVIRGVMIHEESSEIYFNNIIFPFNWSIKWVVICSLSRRHRCIVAWIHLKTFSHCSVVAHWILQSKRHSKGKIFAHGRKTRKWLPMSTLGQKGSVESSTYCTGVWEAQYISNNRNRRVDAVLMVMIETCTPGFIKSTCYFQSFVKQYCWLYFDSSFWDWLTN